MSHNQVSAFQEKEMDVYPSRLHSEPRLLKRQDPVVYSDWTPDASITLEQSEFYERNGYLFLEGFFDREELQHYQAEARSLQVTARESEKDEVIREPGGDEVRSVFAVHHSHAVFQELSQHPRLLAIVEYLLGSETYIHQSRINYKPGFTGKEFYWHSDFETWHVEDGMPRMRALSCSIALEDNYPFNGPLMVVPGSHKEFVACVGKTPDNHFKDSLRKQEYGVPDHDSLTRLVKEGGIDTPVGKAGSIVLFDCNIMHGSNSNITPMPRSNIFMVYNSVENKIVQPYSGQSPRPEYIAARDSR
ncbi:ectoine hydroxylase [Paenibacillus glucanolyticus]|jgi:ectoine hydroxylase|uniref:Ectoine hydroxylase n=1 Tax=Paenibacillus glucanolyticus TaxID=59843 RepID=A0A163HK47_9BACL|nr:MULTISPECIES: ectoine hydroxylase [Paenibacillus]ANA79579.1 ectoine hydroxylase [Paenibacillus glucanolyticus]AVV56471.1 ectoine hydroxylase [Paenibacillus glucanolyticus]AWP25632.1 ectoine hydroxylase [Paenibacillus sp. Cedars]ETT31257.1 ectoine hydroxylase [Paenibacillus sp. FSL R5-808]KZS45524.1 ectoine hydroxylase [Paenibacillus glucanolyticus]